MKLKYGIFIYDKQTDENINHNYYKVKETAISIAKSLKIDKDNYVEVWEQDENGTWGNSGSPIWKSDN